ncbi:MAG: hypothetical protein M3151_09140 [Actinomycetota bacterium]|nr:hypothetical protein [Actinomycetota bacterium]
MDGNNRDAVSRLEAEEHLFCVGPVPEMIEGDRDEGAIESYAICAGVEVVGFFGWTTTVEGFRSTPAKAATAGSGDA